MSGRRLVAGLVALALVGAGVVAARRAGGSVAPPAEHRARVAEQYPEVSWITADELEARLTGRAARAPLVIDVRTADEYRVSHLAGAVRLDPDTLDVDVLPAPAPDDRDVVVYCSLGYRSAAAVAALREAGYGPVRNLDGGIFGWANEGRALVNEQGATSLVHPYDDHWAQAVAPAVRAPME